MLKIIGAALLPGVTTSPITPQVGVRIKEFISRILVAVDELKEESRFKWFEDNTLPNHFHYYSIGSNLPSPAVADSEINSKNYVLEHGFYPIGRDDYMVMRVFSHEALAAEPVGILDGLVGIHKAQWHPEIMMQLNPDQEPIDEHFLGIMATTHVNLLMSHMLEGPHQHGGYPRELRFKVLIYEN